MLANVNIGQVQPIGQVEHLKDTDRDSDQIPILHADVLETIEEQTEESDRQDGTETDGLSVSSMDMLVDREKPGFDNKSNYGATGWVSIERLGCFNIVELRIELVTLLAVRSECLYFLKCFSYIQDILNAHFLIAFTTSRTS